MRKRRNAAIIAVAAVSLALFTFSCAQDGGSTVAADGSAPASGGMFVALGNVANKNEAAAFRLLTYAPGKDVDPASVKFCFGYRAACASGEGLIVAATPLDVQGRQVFASEKYVKLSHDLRLTVLAKDKSGADLTTGVTIVDKGKKPTVATNPSTSTATGTATATGSATSTGSATGTSTASTGGSTPSPCYKAPSELTCKVELEITRLTNEKRQGSGLGALTYDAKVAYVSRLWSEEQARVGVISHEWYERGILTQKYSEEFGEVSPITAENVAMNVAGNDPTQIAAAFVEQWWTSEGHKANILSPNATIIGVGYATGGAGGAYATQNFGRR